MAGRDKVSLHPYRYHDRQGSMESMQNPITETCFPAVYTTGHEHASLPFSVSLVNEGRRYIKLGLHLSSLSIYASAASISGGGGMPAYLLPFHGGPVYAGTYHRPGLHNHDSIGHVVDHPITDKDRVSVSSLSV